MTATRKMNSPIKTITGIVSFDIQFGGTSLITTNGCRYEIAQNDKGRDLSTHLLETVTVIGRVLKKPHRLILQVLYFHPPSSGTEWDTSLEDEIIQRANEQTSVTATA